MNMKSTWFPQMKHQNKLLNFSRTCIFWKAKYMIKVLWSLILQSLHLRHGSWCLNLGYKRTVLSSVSVSFPDGYTQFSPSFDGNIKLITRFPQPGAQQRTRIDTFMWDRVVCQWNVVGEWWRAAAANPQASLRRYRSPRNHLRPLIPCVWNYCCTKYCDSIMIAN